MLTNLTSFTRSNWFLVEDMLGNNKAEFRRTNTILRPTSLNYAYLMVIERLMTYITSFMSSYRVKTMVLGLVWADNIVDLVSLWGAILSSTGKIMLWF